MMMAVIIAWLLQCRVRALTDENVPDASYNATKPGFVAGIYGYRDRVSAADGWKRPNYRSSASRVGNSAAVAWAHCRLIREVNTSRLSGWKGAPIQRNSPESKSGRNTSVANCTKCDKAAAWSLSRQMPRVRNFMR